MPAVCKSRPRCLDSACGCSRECRSLTGRGSDVLRHRFRALRAWKHWGVWILAPLLAVTWLVGVWLVVELVPAAVVELVPAATNGLDATGRAEEISRARTDRVTLLGILVASVGAFFAARTYWLNRRGQITDRFTRAVEQLGNKTSIDVRLGGIYAMEQIARDSKKDHRTTMEVLTAFVQVHAPWPSTEDASKQKRDTEDPSDPARPRPDADVMGALMVLGRRNSKYDKGLRLNLPRTDLRGARLRREEAQFEGARLRYANLRGAHLQGAHLDDAKLRQANLQGAHLSCASLANADLDGADLTGAKLKRANLKNATLCEAKPSPYEGDERSEPVPASLDGAHLEGANLEGAILKNATLREAILSPYKRDEKSEPVPTILKNADLRGAHLEGAKLDRAILDGAKLNGVHEDATTVWPVGWRTREERERREVLDP